MKQLYAISSFLCLAALLAASCTTSLTDEPDTTARAIAFSTPQAGTRVAVTSSADMGDFSVWGGYGGSVDNVFKSTTILSPNWDYRDGTRYWIPGKTYNFYAVHPAGLNASVADDGTITVTDFDCSKTGSEAVDLMTATAPGDGDNPEKVAMEFQHELAKVNILVKTEEGMAYVTGAKLSGMLYKGTLTRTGDISGWTGTVKAEDINTPYERTEQLEVDLKGISLLNEMLLIPQTIQTNSIELVLTYNYGYDGSEKNTTAYLPAITWNAGQSYTYTLTIEADGRIHFGSPTINTWGEALGGIIIVD